MDCFNNEIILFPSENKPLAAAIEENPRKKPVIRHPTKKCKETEDHNNENSDIVTCGLFVCGQHNTTILLLLDEAAEQNPDLILSLVSSKINLFLGAF